MKKRSELAKTLLRKNAKIPQKHKRLLNSPKFALWVKLFMDKSNKKTFGNQTQSAILAYNLDPEKQYDTGSTIGKENIRKLQNVAGMYLEKRGLTYGKMLDVAMSNMIKTRSIPWYNKVAELTQHSELKVEEKPEVVQNTQINILSAEATKDWSGDFLGYLEKKANK